MAVCSQIFVSMSQQVDTAYHSALAGMNSSFFTVGIPSCMLRRALSHTLPAGIWCQTSHGLTLPHTCVDTEQLRSGWGKLLAGSCCAVYLILLQPLLPQGLAHRTQVHDASAHTRQSVHVFSW